ncbi:MAG: hypothetical protein ABJI81_14425, partial [Bauldia litoralis]
MAESAGTGETMDARRTTVWIGVIVLLLGVGVLVYFDYGLPPKDEPAPATATTSAPGGTDTPDAAAPGEALPSETAGSASSPAEPSDAAGTARETAAAPMKAAEADVEVAEGAPADAGTPDEAVAET